MVRWLRFNLVGVMGFALQTVTLWLLVRGAGIGAVAGVTLAVLAAVSHNFAWHERFTCRTGRGISDSNAGSRFTSQPVPSRC